jgi:tetratricopeptide (TPR) repeat protein
MMNLQAAWRLRQRTERLSRDFLAVLQCLRFAFVPALGRRRLLAVLLVANTTLGADEYLLTPSTYEALSAVHELMEEGQYFSALKKLDALQGRVRGKGANRAYEQAVILQTLGHVYSSLEKYPQAIQAFRDSLALEALPERVAYDLHYNLAQLYIAVEQYAEGVQYLEKWFKETEAPSAEAYVLLANGYYHLQQYPKVIPPIQKAIELREKPQEAWYQLYLAAHLELQQYPQAAQVLTVLISQFPKKEQYWKQLAAVYLEMDEEYRALAVQALAAQVGPLEGKGLIYLSNLYRYLNIPYKAARVLQQGLRAGAIEANVKNWERLADAWSAARELEEAVEAFEEAGKKSQDGKMDLRRGQLLIGLGRWDEANAALQQALRKGDLDDPGQARFLLGHARYEQGRLADAIEALELAQRSPKYRKQAIQLIKYVKAIQKQRTAG